MATTPETASGRFVSELRLWWHCLTGWHPPCAVYRPDHQHDYVLTRLSCCTCNRVFYEEDGR